MNMKKYLLLLAAVIPATLWAAEPVDTIITKTNKKVIVTDTAGTTKVKVLENDGKEEKMTFEGHYSDQQDVEQYFFSPFIPNKKKGNRYFEASYPSVFLGFNNLESHCLSSMNDLAPNVSSSSEWGITITTFSFPLDKMKDFGITAAAQIKNVHNYFSGNHILTTDDNGQTYLKEDTRDIQKSYLSYWAFKVPVMLEGQRMIGKLFMSIGFSLELRSGEHSRYKTDGHKHTETTDVNLNHVGLNVESYIGYDGFMIYCNCGLTPLLNTHNAPKYYTGSIGVAFKL
jgi:hypothetical protein